MKVSEGDFVIFEKLKRIWRDEDFLIFEEKLKRKWRDMRRLLSFLRRNWQGNEQMEGFCHFWGEIKKKMRTYEKDFYDFWGEIKKESRCFGETFKNYREKLVDLRRGTHFYQPLEITSSDDDKKTKRNNVRRN